MDRVRLAICLIFAAVVGTRPASGDSRKTLEYAPAPVDNPLKGLVPYRADVRDKFPHTLEFDYIPYSALAKGCDTFDWKPLERVLGDIASRGHQAVIRIFLEYPGAVSIAPQC